MNRTFFISDSHFGHSKILTFEAVKPFRPFKDIEEHDEALVAAWNKVVRPQDTVWHLGDFSMGKDSLAIAGRLNGNKKLVMGNHDTRPSEEYLKYFTKIFGAAHYKGFLLTHVPVTEICLTRYIANIHGHLHENLSSNPKHINVSVEQLLNFAPVEFNELIGKWCLDVEARDPKII